MQNELCECSQNVELAQMLAGMTTIIDQSWCWH